MKHLSSCGTYLPTLGTCSSCKLSKRLLEVETGSSRLGNNRKLLDLGTHSLKFGGDWFQHLGNQFLELETRGSKIGKRWFQDWEPILPRTGNAWFQDWEALIRTSGNQLSSNWKNCGSKMGNIRYNIWESVVSELRTRGFQDGEKHWFERLGPGSSSNWEPMRKLLTLGNRSFTKQYCFARSASNTTQGRGGIFKNWTLQER